MDNESFEQSSTFRKYLYAVFLKEGIDVDASKF